MGSTDKDYRTFTGDVERASGTNFPEEYVDNETKEEKCEVVGKIRSTFLAAVRLRKLLSASHQGELGIKQDGSGKEAGGKRSDVVRPKVGSCASASREVLYNELRAERVLGRSRFRTRLGFTIWQYHSETGGSSHIKG